LTETFFGSTKPLKYKTEKRQQPGGFADVFDRQKRLNRFKQEKIDDGKIAIVGAGGFGGRMAEMCSRIGFGHILIMDDDHVEFSNLNRQWFFWEQAERMENKAIATAENLKAILVNATKVEAYPYAFQRTIEEEPKALEGSNLLFCFVDNEDTRHDVSKYCLDHKIPAIFGAVSREAINGQAFVQKPGGACLACLRDREIFKQKVEANTEGGTRCVDPSAIYAQTALLGVCLYAGLAILMEWSLSWNVYELMLDRESYAYLLERKTNCKGCGK